MPHYLFNGFVIPLLAGQGGDWGTIGNSTTSERKQMREQQGLPSPQNFRLCSLGRRSSVRVVYYLYDYGRLMVTAPSLIRAYEVARAVLGCFVLIRGAVRDDDELLMEVTAIPKSSWDEERLLAALKDTGMAEDTALRALLSGTGLSAHDLRYLKTYLPSIVNQRRLHRCLSHLGLSRFLFYGYMSGSYYSSHYRHDRKNTPAAMLRREYFEHQERYELAFLAAFKALEAFFDVAQIKTPQIAHLFANSPFANVIAASIYDRKHETFRKFRKKAPFDEMLEHYLTVRNATAAHANRTPPTHLMVTADTVYEIQRFVKVLCSLALPDQELARLPAAAIVRRVAKD